MGTHLVSKITTVPAISTDERKGIIGSSQIGVICGLENCYSTPYEVYMSYMGIEKEIDPQQKDIFEAGHILEEPIAKFFSYKTGQQVNEIPYMYIDPDHPQLILHPDREFTNTIDGKRYALECKTASSYSVESIKWPEPEIIDSSKRPSFIPLSVPIYDGHSINPGYYAQCMWYFNLGGYDGVFLCRLTDNKFYIYYVYPDSESQKILYERTIMWKSAVDNGWVPPAQNLDDIKLKFPVCNKESVLEADKELVSLVNKYHLLESTQKQTEENLKKVKTQLCEKIGNFESVSYANNKICTFKNQVKSGLNSQKLLSELPEVYQKYFDPQLSKFRVLRCCVKECVNIEEQKLKQTA